MKEKAKVYVGLVHYPIYNRNMDIVATAVTNFDVHDLARTCRTYDVARYFVIHPHESQARLVQDIIGYWRDGYGSEYNPDRKEAFQVLELAASIEEACKRIEEAEGQRPLIVTTDARVYPNSISYRQMRSKLQQDSQPWLILFGTGWGIEAETMSRFDAILEPIYGPGEYNHLPVRSAVAIILDRLLGEAWYEAESARED